MSLRTPRGSVAPTKLPAASKDCIVVNHWLLTPFTMSFHQWLIDVVFPPRRAAGSDIPALLGGRVMILPLGLRELGPRRVATRQRLHQGQVDDIRGDLTGVVFRNHPAGAEARVGVIARTGGALWRGRRRPATVSVFRRRDAVVVRIVSISVL